MRCYQLLLVLVIIIFASCRKDFDAELLTSGELGFSKDTVYLDTVFTNIGSSTYNLKVYNKSNKAISIPSVKLGNGEESFYRLNVDGQPGKIFSNVEILANDSLYVFIETTINYSKISNPIYTDAIVFDTGLKTQSIELVTLVQDAHFLYPTKGSNGIIETIELGIDSEGEQIKIQGFELNENTTFTNEKPYVIYGYCAVKENNTLTIEAGSRIYFHANSGLIVNKNATISINGELGNEILFEGDRLEPEFSNISGQWGAIWLRAGSKNNSINHAIIKNASIGVLSDSIYGSSPSLTLKNTQIYNSSNFGILGRETHIEGENLVINNSGQSSLACTIGGTYKFTHSTFANYWSNTIRQYPTVLINNYFSYNENSVEVIETRDLKSVEFTNCIIDGSNAIELLLDKVGNGVFNYSFKNNLIKFNDTDNTFSGVAEYNFENTDFFLNNIFNENAHFKSVWNNELIVGENSAGNQKANSSGTFQVPIDILGVERSSPGDIGAYQHIIFEN
jgi:hypothetical protein